MNNGRATPISALMLGAVIISFAPILARMVLHSVGPTMVGVYRCGFGAAIAIVLCAVMRERQPVRIAEGGRVIKFLCAAGVFFALDLTLWHKSIAYAGAGIATILANTQVLYTSLLGFVLWREKPTPRFLLAVPLAFAGIFCIVRFKGVGSGEQFNLGVILGLVAGLFYAMFLLSLRGSGKAGAELPTLQKLLVISVVTAATMTLVAALEGDLCLPRGTDWVYLLLLGAGPQIAGWLLITSNLPKVPLATGSLILLAQPAFATLLGSLCFGEQVSGMQLAGVALSLGAIYLGTTGAPRTSS